MKLKQSPIPIEIAPMLQEFADLLRSKLPHAVLGLYIQGSIALSGFNKNKSDIDFIVVLQNASITDDDVAEMLFIHEELMVKHSCYMVAEGQYTSVEHLNKSYPNNEDRFPSFYYGKFQGLRSGTVDITSSWILKHYGISVFGPEVDSLDIHVSWDDIQMAMDYNLNVYWTEKAKSVELLYMDEWIDFAVLTLGRIVYTLEHKGIVTKDEGGAYLLRELPLEWHSIVNEALRIRQGLTESHYRSPEERALHTQQLISYITNYCNARYNFKESDRIKT